MLLLVALVIVLKRCITTDVIETGGGGGGGGGHVYCNHFQMLYGNNGRRLTLPLCVEENKSFEGHKVEEI